MYTRLKPNATVLVKFLLDKAITIDEAAKLSGVSASRLIAFMRRDDVSVHYKTAAKLTKYFGADSVTILPTKTKE